MAKDGYADIAISGLHAPHTQTQTRQSTCKHPVTGWEQLVRVTGSKSWRRHGPLTRSLRAGQRTVPYLKSRALGTMGSKLLQGPSRLS